MGSSYGAQRSKWAYGQSSLGASVYQDDMAVIAANPFGYRADDHGNTIGNADALDSSSQNVGGSGVIEKVSDVDVFSFYTDAGPVSFTVSGPQFGGLLDATLKIVDLNGNVIASADTASLGETVTANLSAGSYRLIVSSKGTYGDVGQYTIAGTIVPDANYIAAPSNVTATPGAGGVALAWYDNSWNETGFTIERSTDGGATWATLDTVGADVHGYVDATAAVGSTFAYRVVAFNDTDQSGNSNTATVAVTPATPGSLTAASISASRIDLSWADVSGETGYVLERSLNGTTWTTLVTLGADTTSYSDTALAAGTRYFYRLRATSGVGPSATTAAVNAYTRPAQSNLTLTVLATNQITLTWRDVVGELGYRIERTADGTNWSVIGTRGANVLSFADAGLTANTIYSYRVIAYNSGGDGLSANATATTLLPAPTGLTAVGASVSSINLSWANSTGETGYRIERTVDLRTWVIVTTVGADVTSYTNTGLLGGYGYAYRVRAINAGGVSTPSASATGVTTPVAPTLTATPIADTQVSLAWTNVVGETNYVLQRSDDGGSTWSTIVSPTANVGSYVNTGLTADTTYSYRVIAHNATGDSAASNVITPRTLMPAPAGLTGSSSSTSQVNLTWTDSTGETGYRVDRSVDGRTWYVLATLPANTTSYTNTGLVAGYAYAYRVRAINAGGVSTPAAVTVTTLPAAPALVATPIADTQVSLAWTNVAGETNYVLQRSDDGGSTWSTIVSPAANVATYINTGLTADTTYAYRVFAHNASGDSAASAVLTPHTLMPAPAGLTGMGSSTTQVNLTWTDSATETGYRIDRSVDGRTWYVMTTLPANTTSYSNTGLAAGYAYAYRVRAINAGGVSAPAAVTVMTLPAAPGLAAAPASDTRINLGWTNVYGETNYVLQRSDDGGSTWNTIISPAANVITYVNTGLTADTTYSYRVIAHNASGDSAASNVVTPHTLLPTVTGLTAVGASTTQVNLTWDDSTGETGYTIDRFNGKVYVQIGTTAADVHSFTNTGLVAGATYYYRVHAINAGGASLMDGTFVPGTTIPLATALTTTAVSNTSIRLNWTNVAGETGYRIERSADGSTGWTTIKTAGTDVLNYIDTGLTTDTPYFYRVTAFNASGDAAASAVKTTRTLLPAPTGLAASSPSATQVNLTWNDSTGETGYVIERTVDLRTWTAIASLGANVTAYSNTGLSGGYGYAYRVRAVNAGGNSDASTSVTQVTRPAAPAVATNSPLPTQVNLSWTNVLSETGYRVEWSANGSTWSVLTTTAANVVSASQTGLTENALYYYRVTPFTASGDGATSTVVSRRTVLSAPTGVTATAPTPTTVAVHWNDSTGETGYRIERFSGVSWAPLVNLAANVTSYTDAGLVKGKLYYYRVRALNAGGDSPIVAGVAVTTPLSSLVAPKASTTVKSASIFQSSRTITDLLAA
jgi:titin